MRIKRFVARHCAQTWRRPGARRHGQEDPGRTHLAGHLDAGFLLDPIEEGLDGLTYPRNGARQPGVGGVEMHLALRLLDRRHHGERQPVRPLEVFIRVGSREIMLTLGAAVCWNRGGSYTI